MSMTPEAIMAAATAVERAYRLERGLPDRREAWRTLDELATKYRQHPSSDPEPGTKESWRL